MAVDLTPNREMQEAAERGLRLYEDGRGGDGLVPATIADARKMTAREALSENKVRRMPAWFARHEADERPGWDTPGEETPGFVAWLLWGGDAGRRWSETKVRQLDQEANAMGRDKADAAIERREILTVGQRLVADALLDGAKEYGRYDAEASAYVEQAAEGQSCASCIFYRASYPGPEGCTIVAANVAPEGGCRFHMAGELPPSGDEESYVDPITGEVMQEVEPPAATLDEAQDELDDALQLPGALDKDDEDKAEAETPESTPTINISIDIDNGENHNAEGDGAKAVAGDMEVSEETETEVVYPYRSRETHTTRSAKAEWRESGAGTQYRTLTGYASVFNTPSDELGGFREMIAPGAFTRALESPEINVALLWNHDPDTVMASTRNGTLELTQDKKGLRMWARVDMEDFDAQRVVGKIRSGLVDQMSFAFTIADDGDEWDVREGKPFRIVRDVDALYDVSAVTWPAYPVGTKVELLDRALRSGRVPGPARATVAQADPAGTTSSLTHEGEALRQLKAKAKSRLTIVKFNLTR